VIDGTGGRPPRPAFSGALRSVPLDLAHGEAASEVSALEKGLRDRQVLAVIKFTGHRLPPAGLHGGYARVGPMSSRKLDR